MQSNALSQYKQSSVFTATPEELTLMLYDGGIKFMNIAKYSIENHQIEKSHQALIRAQDIFLELNSSLDMQYEISDNLKTLYNFIIERLIDANINKDIKLIEEALEVGIEIRDTWKELTKNVKKTVYKNRRV